jgi:hypothetical protein
MEGIYFPELYKVDEWGEEGFYDLGIHYPERSDAYQREPEW